MELEEIETLEDSIKYLRKHIVKKGANCPCCQQFAKIYRRSLTYSMVHALALIYKSGTKDYFHVEEYLKDVDCSSSVRGDFPKLRFWLMLKAFDGPREDGSKRNGYYKITSLGEQFLKGKIEVPSFVKIYNNKKYGESEEMINIEQAVKNKFNYRELMK
jgi:hypothetical protein